MDEPAVEAAGLTPLDSALDAIAKLSGPKDLPPLAFLSPAHP
jgi:hypothetical protein